MSTNNDTPKSGGYRLKFKREEFLKLLSIAEPKRLYRVQNFVYFAFDGFIMYSSELTQNEMMRYDIIQAIEFTNVPWKKVG